MVQLRFLPPLAACLAATVGCVGPATLSKSESRLPPSPVSPVASPNPLAQLERSLVFAPSPYPEGNWQPEGLPFEDAWFAAPDGTRLHGWYVPHPSPKAIVLYCHGNGGNVAKCNYHGPLLHSHGTGDRLIPFAMGRQLFEAANEPKQFLSLPDRDHNDPQPDTYYLALSQFLAHLP